MENLLMINAFKKSVVIRLLLLASVILIGYAIVTRQLPPFWSNNSQASSNNAVIGQGSLVRQEDQEKVYLIHDGSKRWIVSAEAFTRQGFNWDKIVIAGSAELKQFPEGEPITKTSKIILPAQLGILPDLAPFAVQDLSLATINNRKVLRFSSIFWNQGAGPLELVTNGQASQSGSDAYFDAYQHFTGATGESRDIFVGSIYWHDVHEHYHYVDFAEYSLEALNWQGKSAPAPASFKKTTFCLRDNWPVSMNLPGAPARRVYTGCRGNRQGVSVGWTDVYPASLPDQYIDVNDLPAGRYQLSFVIDPRANFLESQQDNNTSVVLLDLDPAANTVKVLASGMPFVSSFNNYVDGLLIKGQVDGKVYVIRDNKKLYLPLEQQNQPAGPVYELP
ncbi:MAG: lysyl oxidase family protein [Candidatus Komeilibacteria bacterium]|nr:lysyl oxidase family protein [Candidatus Komeilibacteria bacterium]